MTIPSKKKLLEEFKSLPDSIFPDEGTPLLSPHQFVERYRKVKGTELEELRTKYEPVKGRVVFGVETESRPDLECVILPGQNFLDVLCNFVEKYQNRYNDENFHFIGVLHTEDYEYNWIVVLQAAA